MSFYGDAFRWFFGTVTETGTDPEELHRVKIRIDGVHGKNISNNDLPYAQCILPTTSGGTSGIGENPAMLPGARVCGFFADGQMSQLPIILGPVPHIGLPNGIQVNNQTSTKEALLTSVRPQSRSFDKTFIPEKTPAGETADNPHIAYHFFSMSPGLHYTYKPHQIAAMIGNFTIEGRYRGIEMNPIAKGKERIGKENEYTSFGIAQWGPDRAKDLRNYAMAFDLDMNDLITQLKFVDWELKHRAYLRGDFFQTKDVLESTVMFMRQYERPQILVDTKSKFVNSGKFGFPVNYWAIRFGEEERVKEARGALNRFTQYYPEA
tara:strand:- start:1849 stop:2811 length:963 start_codon:yes stop_codon:yes gene_type:complete